MFPDLSSEAARAQLEPYHPRFVEAIRAAVRKFNTIEPTLLYTLSRRTRSRATAIWAFIMEEVETTFAGVAGIKLVDRFGSVEIHVGENMIARVKKMRADGFTSNYPTARVTEFHSANQGELFPSLWAKPMRVDVGYIEDETGTQVAQILVARRANLKNIDWTYPMIAPAAVVPMPSRQQPAAQQADDTRIVARESEPSTKEVSNE